MLDTGLHNMDCMDGMKEYPDGYFDLAVVDPPYGINIGHAVRGGGRRKQHIRPRQRRQKTVRREETANYTGGGTPARQNINVYGKSRSALAEQKFYHAFDDSSPPDAVYFRELMRVSRNQIIWGGNYFLDFLGATPCLLIWDKKRRGMTQADCEIAWTSFKGQSRIIDFRWNGMLQGDMKNKEERIHPTQKPVALYDWIFKHYAETGARVLDTHTGSGSSWISAERLGLEFTGFEIDEHYFNMAKQRHERETAQMELFSFLPDADKQKYFTHERSDA